MANLAGVPASVVERADVVSKDFAQQFREKVEGKKTARSTSKIPLTVQADFAYLCSLAMGKAALPDDKVRRRDILRGLKAAAKGYLEHAHVG